MRKITKEETLKRLRKITNTAIRLGFTSHYTEGNTILFRNDVSANYLEDAYGCFKQGYYVACIALSSFCVESCMVREIERELKKIQDSFIKNKYEKMLSKFTFSYLEKDFAELEITNKERLNLILDYSRKLINIRNKYVHVKIKQMLEAGKNIREFYLKDVYNDAKKSLFYASRIISNIGVNRLTLGRLELVKKIKNGKYRKLILQIIYIMDKYDIDFTDKYMDKDTALGDSVFNVFKFLYLSKFKEKDIKIKSLQKNVSIILKFFDKFVKTNKPLSL